MSLKGDMDSSLCRLNVEFARNSLCLIFDDLINSYYISAIVAVKNEKGEMSLKSSIWPSCLIPEITISHACRLKRLETRLIKNKAFL